MVTIRDYLKKIQRAKADIPNNIETIVKQIEEEIIDLNRKSQLLDQGIGTKGQVLGVYSKATEQITKGMTGPGFPKRAGSPYNFYDSGEMFRSVSIKVGNGILTIVNTSETLKLFSRRTGISEDNIVGLTPDNQYTLNFELIRPLLVELIKTNIAK